MKNNTHGKQSGTQPLLIENIGIYSVGILSAAFSFFLFINSMLHTTAVEAVGEGQGVDSIVYTIKEQVESVIYYNDNLFLNLIVLAVSLMISFAIMSAAGCVKLRYKVIFIFIWTFLAAVIWVNSSQSAPSEDSLTVTNAAFAFAHDDFSLLESSRYYSDYSFQLGYIFFNELLIRIAFLIRTPENLLFLQILNGLFLAVINSVIVMINDKVFQNDRITGLTAFVLALSTAPIISSTFVYGIYPGMMFAIIAVYCEIVYFKGGSLIYGAASALSICIAVMLKSNYIIWLIAMVLTAVVQILKRKKYLVDGAVIVLAIVLSLSVQGGVKRMYEGRSGVEIGSSVPYVSWIAMGLNESHIAPGWYNPWFTLSNFENNGLDASKAAQSSKEEIKARIGYFRDNPQYANDFFYLKATSQWNDTSYQSIWNNVVRNQYRDKSEPAAWVCGEGKAKTKRFMDYYAQMVFFAFCIGCVIAVKEKNFFALFIPLIFVGGFMYQLISEGKSQYIMPYFIIMSGYCPCGIYSLYEMTLAWLKRRGYVAG